MKINLLLYLLHTMNERPAPRDKNTLRDYFALSEVFTYFFRKPDPNRKPNFNLRVMHGINKISILMFLVGVVFFIIKVMSR